MTERLEALCFLFANADGGVLLVSDVRLLRLHVVNTARCPQINARRQPIFLATVSGLVSAIYFNRRRELVLRSPPHASDI